MKYKNGDIVKYYLKDDGYLILLITNNSYKHDLVWCKLLKIITNTKDLVIKQQGAAYIDRLELIKNYNTPLWKLLNKGVITNAKD